MTIFTAYRIGTVYVNEHEALIYTADNVLALHCKNVRSGFVINGYLPTTFFITL